MILTGTTEVLGEIETCPNVNLPTTNPTWNAWERTRYSTVRSRELTATAGRAWKCCWYKPVWCIRGAECDTDYQLVAAEHIEGKRKSDIKKRGSGSVMLKYWTVLQASRNCMVEPWENVTDDIKMAAQLYADYYKQSVWYRPFRFLDKIKEPQLWWIHHLSKIKEDDLNNARR